MDKLKILHTADLHMGSPFTGSGFDADRIKQRKKDLFDCFSGILKTAQKKKVDLIIISGDLFEENRVKLSEINSILQSLSETAPIRVILLPGNHDHIRPGGYYDWLQMPPNVFLFRNREFDRFEFEDLSLAVYGSAFNSQEDSERILSRLRFDDNRKYRIAAFHGSLIPEGDETNVKYRPFSETEISDLGIDYVALGHYHKPLIMKNTHGRIIASYPGSPEPLNFGETHTHSFNIVTIENNSVNIETIPSSIRKYFMLNIDCSGMNTEKDVTAACRKTASSAAAESDIIGFNLKGRLEKGLKFDKDVIAAEMRKHYFWVKVTDETYPDIDIESISREETTRGGFARHMLELMEAERQSADTEKIERLNDALFYGLSALDGKRPEKR